MLEFKSCQFFLRRMTLVEFVLSEAQRQKNDQQQ